MNYNDNVNGRGDNDDEVEGVFVDTTNYYRKTMNIPTINLLKGSNY